ncbi:MAG: enoyl-CoA hydratase/isomerase family protein, partial [Bdellovibrionota bacterium]
EAKILKWFDRYRATNLRIFTYPRPTVAAINGHAIAGGLITALDCDYRIAATESFGYCLNEVPIGIPMPAVYLEIIRYATGTPLTSRAALFGEQFDNEAALELGITHEMVVPEDLIKRAVEKASSIQPNCFNAYAYSKAALQAPTLAAIKTLDAQFDRKVGSLLGSKESLSVLAEKYRELKGQAPEWDPR